MRLRQYTTPKTMTRTPKAMRHRKRRSRSASRTILSNRSAKLLSLSDMIMNLCEEIQLRYRVMDFSLPFSPLRHKEKKKLVPCRTPLHPRFHSLCEAFKLRAEGSEVKIWYWHGQSPFRWLPKGPKIPKSFQLYPAHRSLLWFDPSFQVVWKVEI